MSGKKWSRFLLPVLLACTCLLCPLPGSRSVAAPTQPAGVGAAAKADAGRDALMPSADRLLAANEALKFSAPHEQKPTGLRRFYAPFQTPPRGWMILCLCAAWLAGLLCNRKVIRRLLVPNGAHAPPPRSGGVWLPVCAY